MELTSIFLLPDGRLRAGWRLLLFLVFFLPAWVLFNGMAAVLFRRQVILSQTVLLAAASVAGLAAVGVSTWLILFLVDHQPFGAVGLAVEKRSVGEMAVGLAGGAGLVGTVTAVEWAVGAIHFQPSEISAASGLVLIGASAGILAVAAVSEELLFRGYPFQRLVEGTNGAVALVISSVVFGGLHKANPHSTDLSVANTMLAGALLSLAYLKTRALWLPIGFHFSWNGTLALVGLPVSGVNLIRMPWEAVPAASRIWLHGGDYGPEGGLVATGVLIAGIFCLIMMREKTSPPTERDGPPPETGDRLSRP